MLVLKSLLLYWGGVLRSGITLVLLLYRFNLMTRVEKTKKELKTIITRKYYTCERCGYVTIVKGSVCPICAKEGLKIKLI